MLWIKDSMRGRVTQKRRRGAGVLWVGEASAQSRLREVPEALKPRRIEIARGDTVEAKAVETVGA